MPKAGAGAPLDLQDERSKGGHPLQFGRGIMSLGKGAGAQPRSTIGTEKNKVVLNIKSD